MKISMSKLRNLVSEAVGESTALARPADLIVARREKLDSIKDRMRGVADTLNITVGALREDIPRIGGRGVTMRDLHGAVISLTRNADMFMDLLEELEGLREGVVRESWDDGPDLMAMTAEELRTFQGQIDDPNLKDQIERELEERKAAYRAGGYRGAR